MREKNTRTLLKLFITTFYLSAFTFGGGYVIVSLMKKKFVDELQWIEEEEMLDLTAISQSAPGPIAVNASILVGYRIAGATGAIIAILGTVIPPMVVLSIVSIFYTAFKGNQIISDVLKGMQAAVAAIICDVVLNLGTNVVKEKDFTSILIMLGAFYATFFLNINVVYIILIVSMIGILKAIIRQFISGKEKK